MSTDEGRHFLHDIIDADLASGRHQGVVTRFPPEPNGYLHIGHAKAICVDFGLAAQYGGRCHLRMDDTNPTKEDVEYVASIQNDIRWLGFDWGEHMYYASDYFERLYQFAVELIDKGLAYVDSSTEAEIREMRGTLLEPGTHSPFRDRSIAENRDLFARMREGEFEDGAHVLRAKIDMSASNMKMRDPLLYRIRRGAHHYRTGDAWRIYPMYDFAHCLSDAIEGVTHSICTLEFENNRELYDWIIEALDTPATPHQFEFARLKLDYTVMSKRKLIQLVKDGHVSGWDDPRMPTLAGYRRRGYTPASIRNFCDQIGVAKTNSVIGVGRLEAALRDDLNHKAPRVMAVLEPLEVELLGFDGSATAIDAPYFPADVGKPGSRSVPISDRIYIERSDFSVAPPKGWKRLSPGGSVRLRHAFVIRCEDVIEGEDGSVQRLRCRVERGPDAKASGVIHWVCARGSLAAEVRIYDRLFSVPQPDAGDDFLPYLNPESLRVVRGARIEPSVLDDAADTRYQFERQGYFWRDLDSTAEGLVFNRIATLRDSWSAKTAVAAPEAPAMEKSTRSKTRPAKRSRAEYREEARRRDPALAAAFRRYKDELGLDDGDADVLTGDVGLSRFFDEAVAAHPSASEVAKWVVNEVLREVKETPITELPIRGAALGRLAAMVEAGTISSAIAKDVLATMVAEGGDPQAIVAARGLEQVSDDGALVPMVEAVVAENGGQVAQYRAGKVGLMGFFVGQVMKRTGGKANPQRVKELLAAALEGGGTE